MIELTGISRTYRRAGLPEVAALRGVSLGIGAGEFVAVLGPSGSGKSTLMAVMGLLDRPDAGIYRLRDQTVAGLSEEALATLRNRAIGFVFQAYHLLPRTTALENVQLPLLYAGRRDHRQRARAALAAVGLGDRADHYAHELSGGQQQRVAIARAIANEPALILADEPTGNLDPAAADGIMALFEALNAQGVTLVLITHDEAVAARARRVVRLEAGVLVSDRVREAVG
ncbi:MAG TPA: ABC transporter ATP-binding protein [Azospirillaceae bacterium]|nr:ABC transporter ATP-binding protein [Azospirillaceae bacterium]